MNIELLEADISDLLGTDNRLPPEARSDKVVSAEDLDS
jgi:hypothetical protein